MIKITTRSIINLSKHRRNKMWEEALCSMYTHETKLDIPCNIIKTHLKKKKKHQSMSKTHPADLHSLPEDFLYLYQSISDPRNKNMDAELWGIHEELLLVQSFWEETSRCVLMDGDIDESENKKGIRLKKRKTKVLLNPC